MQQEPLDYRNPSTRTKARSAWPVALAAVGGGLFIVSVFCCVLTWNTPGKLIFVPAGDAVMGFRSSAGWLTWIEYTDWDKREYPAGGSLPWLAPFAMELLPVAFLVWRRQRGKSEKRFWIDPRWRQ